jgi:hypothetical protein
MEQRSVVRVHRQKKLSDMDIRAELELLCDYRGSISSGHRPNEEEEARFVEWDDFVQVRSFRLRFEVSRLFGWERQNKFQF